MSLLDAHGHAVLECETSCCVIWWQALVSVMLLIALGGCATTSLRPPDTAYQPLIGTVAIVATDKTPELQFEGFVRGKGTGAAIGAGGTFANCMAELGGGGCSGSMCGAVIILALGICSLAGFVGGVAGAVAAPNPDQVVESEAKFARAFETRTIQESLRNNVVDSALLAGVNLVSLPEGLVKEATEKNDYRLLAPHGVDTVLETTLTKAGTSGIGINDPSTAYLQVHVRLVATSNNSERFATDYMYLGRRLDLAGWSANQAKSLIDEIDKGYRTLGKHIAENIFQLYPYPDRERQSAGGMLSSAFGLAPIYPPTRGTLTGDRFFGAIFEWYAVDNLAPHFRWEAFPRASDIAASPEDMSRVKNVVYDFVIAKEENMAPSDVVYRKEGLTSPNHAVVDSLQSGRRYFWTVRARFDLDGRSRVTEWSSTHFFAREGISAPSRFAFRFRTPSN